MAEHSAGPLPPKPPPEPSPRVSAPVLRKATTVWSARVAGATWQQAAEVAGYRSREAAMKAVRNTYGQLPRIERDDARHLWRERGELLWRQALRDALDQRSGAVTAAVRVIQAMTALDGLNAPAQVVLHSPSEAEIEEWVSQVLSLTVPAVEEADVIDVEYSEEMDE
jgi:hypothetical protein